MKLSKQDAALFYKLNWALLYYVNQEFTVIKGLTKPDFKDRDRNQIQLLHKILFSNIELIDSFIDENPFNFNKDELTIIEKWKTFIKGKFCVISHPKEHTIFLQPFNNPKAYAVLGLYEDMSDFSSNLPVYADTVLLPFKEKIIYSGMIKSNFIRIEEPENEVLMNIYQKAKNRFGIIRSLDEIVIEDEDLDEDFGDLIASETDIAWYMLEPELPKMPTEILIEALKILGLYVNKKIVMEIAKRDDAVFWLRKVIQDGRYWDREDYGGGWLPIHAIHILPLINTKESLELLLDTIRYRSEEIDHWLTENVASILIAFGEDAIEDLKHYSSDETLDSFTRSTVTLSLAFLTTKYPSHEDNVKEHLLKLLNTTSDPTFACLVAGDLASFHDPSVMPDIRKAFEEDRMDEIIDSEEEIELTIAGEYDSILFNTCKKYPLDHFSRGNIEYLHSINDSNSMSDNIFLDDDPFEFEYEDQLKKIKVGRNEPCPCGSGKKYKKCCMGKGA
ncbi:MAG: SEC-C domain-containing protein [Methanosarcinaceae archaeon]|nr:SEC-C domain-containing protein [Methanosarcinaceae archaeon]